MGFDVIERMDASELREMVGSLLWQFRLVDAFWFINVENRSGLAEAEKVNELVWGKVGELAMRDLKKRFGPFPEDLSGLVRAFELYPWSLMDAYEVERGDGELIVTAPACPAQEGRKRHGLGEYACREMHRAEFLALAGAVSPDIEVHCDFAPPDPHPEGCYCRWRFTMREPGGEAINKKGDRP